MKVCVLVLPELISIHIFVRGVTDNVKDVRNLRHWYWMLPAFYEAAVDCEYKVLKGRRLPACRELAYCSCIRESQGSNE